MSRTDLLPGIGPVLSLRQAFYRAGRDHRGGVTSLALAMDIPYDALQKKLNIERENQWLNPDEIEDVVRLTRDPRLLAALVRPAGAVAYVPKPVPATREALRALGVLLEKEAAFVGSLHTGAADGVWEEHEVELLRHHANKVICEVLGIVAGAEEAMLAQQGLAEVGEA